MQKRKPFRHLSGSDRDRIHALYVYGHNQKSIASVLGVDPGTISRELNRYGRTTWRYNAGRAEKDAREKRKGARVPA